MSELGGMIPEHWTPEPPPAEVVTIPWEMQAAQLVANQAMEEAYETGVVLACSMHEHWDMIEKVREAWLRRAYEKSHPLVLG